MIDFFYKKRPLPRSARIFFLELRKVSLLLLTKMMFLLLPILTTNNKVRDEEADLVLINNNDDLELNNMTK